MQKQQEIVIDTLKDDLEEGKIVLFGSSELTNHGHKFIPENFFNKRLGMPLTSNGHAGHQSFAIMSQLASYSNTAVRKNAKVIVFLSPAWFMGRYSKGTSIPSFLEYMDRTMMYRLYFKSDIDNRFKSIIGDYIKDNMLKMNNPTSVYKYASEYSSFGVHTIVYDELNKRVPLFLDSSHDSVEVIKYRKPMLDFTALEKEALLIAKPSTNNEFGIYNEYYTKYIQPKIIKGDFPFKIGAIPLEKNQEYKDFLNLVDVLSEYDIKPLFIMQDLNPLTHSKNRESINPTLQAIENVLNKHNYGYLDMWSYSKKNYKIGKLTDTMHTGELGWVEIDRKIITHFMEGE